MKRLIITLHITCLLIGLSHAHGQSKKEKFRFSSIEQIGLINGTDAVSALIQTINGLSYDGWFTGGGVGIDYYKYRSVPLFFDVRKEFGQQKRKWFAYGEAGYNFPWYNNDEQNLYWNETIKNDHKGGPYYDAGLGFAFYGRKTHAFLLSAGYSYKNLSRTTTTTYSGSSESNVQHYSYHFNRLMIKLGWKF